VVLIPSPVGIIGNEIADELTRQACEEEWQGAKSTFATVIVTVLRTVGEHLYAMK